MSRFHNIDGVDVPYTAAEETARDAEEAEFVAAEPARKWARIRAERDALLAASDYTQVADAPGDTAAWATYRQALRDVPSQSDVDNITWPQEPS
jgi:hypothetical protein